MRYQVALRRLVLNDEQLLASALHPPGGASAVLDPKDRALIQLAALIALNADPASYQSVVDQALAEGATPDEVVAVLVALAPIVGTVRIVSGASDLALALGYDVAAALEEEDGDGSWQVGRAYEGEDR